ncbi:beta-1,3-galactosyltransferase 1 isoform X3 [Corapipo altera]|uniref:beta-1,3-galactosyltransferase 1 isoform X3 n=1 Tax=Corapipo altera TaxID=415028 RepID=UPI000FD67FD3|nr:beta-1,3-galactosyltransferase 1 isoform X3 [Corapipo altera]
MRSGCGSGGGSGRGERPAGRGWRARPMLNLGGVVITPELSARELVRVSRCWKAREKSVTSVKIPAHSWMTQRRQDTDLIFQIVSDKSLNRF